MNFIDEDPPTLRDAYMVGKSDQDFTMIVIRRKPSQIPLSIDLGILKLGGVVCHVDGPHSIVSYEFLIEDKFVKAETILKSHNWIRQLVVES